MKIGISLAGVHYEDGSIYRYRNYEDSVNEFFQYVVEPLRDMGHEVVFYIYSYITPKMEDVKARFQPIIKAEFIDEKTQELIPGTTVQNTNIIQCFNIMLGEDLDVIIRARFDQKFNRNIFEEYDWEFDKFNFLWREPEIHDLPLVNDTFFTFPASMLKDVRDSMLDVELRPYRGIRIALHNMYWTVANRVGVDNVLILDERYVTAQMNDLYTLTRKG